VPFTFRRLEGGLKGASRGLEGGFEGRDLQGGFKAASRGLQEGFKEASKASRDFKGASR